MIVIASVTWSTMTVAALCRLSLRKARTTQSPQWRVVKAKVLGLGVAVAVPARTSARECRGTMAATEIVSVE